MKYELTEISNTKLTLEEVKEITSSFESEFNIYFTKDEFDVLKNMTMPTLENIFRDLTKLKFSKDGTLTLKALYTIGSELSVNLPFISPEDIHKFNSLMEKFLIVVLTVIDEDDETPDELKFKIINLLYGSLQKLASAEGVSVEQQTPNVKYHCDSLLSKYTSSIKTSNLNSYESAIKNLNFLKRKIELTGYKLFYSKGILNKEAILHFLFDLTWADSPLDVNQNVNNGRGAADFKISYGSADATIVEFKLASNSHLKNLEKQITIYLKANSTKNGIRVIIYFSNSQKKKIDKVIKSLALPKSKPVILIDARKSNKKSASTL